MLKIISCIMILFSFCFAQGPVATQSKEVQINPFVQGDSTQFIEQITGIDSVYWRGKIGGNTDALSWTMFTNTITAAEKTGETTQFYNLSDESSWQWYNSIQFKIEQGDSSITSLWVKIGKTSGALSLAIKPDTVGTTTYYYADFGGN